MNDKIAIQLPSNILSPQLAAVEITEFLLPYIGMVLIVIFGFMLKDFATKMSKGIAFSMNKQFKEGDHVLIDGERALIVKIGFTQTVFGVTKSNGDYVWRYVPNERIDYLKLEKIIFDQTSLNNKNRIANNKEEIEELKNDSEEDRR